VIWNQTDPDPGTTFAAFHVIVRDEWGNAVMDSGIQPQGTTAANAQWTLSSALAVGQKYQVQVRVSDGNVWSLWSNIGWLMTNRPPSAEMTDPSGTQTSPTLIGTLRPRFQWRQTDADPGTTFTAFQLKIADESGTILLDTGELSQNSSAELAEWTSASDLPPRKKLQVQVRVYDGFAWSGWSASVWFLIDRSPIANFDWLPKPVWEGDAVRLTNLSIDPDNDSLTSTWTIATPNGSTFIYNTTDVASMPAYAPGTYAVTLTVSDGLLTHSAVKSIVVSPLSITADVTYTPEWLEFHRLKGHRTDTSPKQFYSGEIFVVNAISSSAPVAQVKAWIDTTGMDGQPLRCEVILGVAGLPNVFSGELYDERMMSATEGLPEGAQSIHFEIKYANGVVKRRDVPVEIIGSALQSVGVHRIR
jgi:hypothetical protein